jgi:sec-independent protein translocase protein TatB
MPSFQDSAVIFFLALLLFGPKKLPELARQLGKLMAEFRRASNEFRMQMEEELRIADQEEQQKKIAAMEAAAPVTPAIDTPATTDGSENIISAPVTEEFLVGHPHEQPQSSEATPESASEPAPVPLPIATSGDLHLMPPSTGLPLSNSTLSPVLDSIPQVAGLEAATSNHEPATTEIAISEATQRG